jgi:hypothetical protein
MNNLFVGLALAAALMIGAGLWADAWKTSNENPVAQQIKAINELRGVTPAERARLAREAMAPCTVYVDTCKGVGE